MKYPIPSIDDCILQVCYKRGMCTYLTCPGNVSIFYETKNWTIYSLELDSNSLQDHYWIGLDEHWNEINCLECHGRMNQGIGAVNFISAQRQYYALYKGERREYSPPQTHPFPHKFSKGINKK